MPIIFAICGILALILLITVVKLDTFISFILVALGLGLVTGMPVPGLRNCLMPLLVPRPG